MQAKQEPIMKSQGDAQKIFDVLVFELAYAQYRNLDYVLRDVACESPLDVFLESIKEKLERKDFDDVFFRQVYATAFHTGPIPKHRNHIAMTCEGKMEGGPSFPPLHLWVDLDNLTAQVNTHFKITPPYSFNVEYHYNSSRGGEGTDNHYVSHNIKYSINSVEDPGSISRHFLFKALLAGYVSVIACAIVALAVMALIAMSNPAMIAIATVAVVAGIASYRFFKARNEGVTTKSVASTDSKPENIEEIFRKHFSTAPEAAESPSMAA